GRPLVPAVGGHGQPPTVLLVGGGAADRRRRGPAVVGDGAVPRRTRRGDSPPGHRVADPRVDGRVRRDPATLRSVVPSAGFEPATPSLGETCSIPCATRAGTGESLTAERSRRPDASRTGPRAVPGDRPGGGPCAPSSPARPPRCGRSPGCASRGGPRPRLGAGGPGPVVLP